MTCLKNMFFEYIPDNKDLEDFGLWAFGEDFKALEDIQFMHSWNYHHGNELKLTSTNIVVDDLPKMVNMWVISKRNKEENK